MVYFLHQIERLTVLEHASSCDGRRKSAQPRRHGRCEQSAAVPRSLYVEKDGISMTIQEAKEKLTDWANAQIGTREGSGN